jgi:hypothetical protein
MLCAFAASIVLLGVQPVTVHVLGQGFTKVGRPAYWHIASGVGIDGRMLWTQNNDARHGRDNIGTWTPTIVERARYEVLAYVPARNGTTRHAKYEVSHSDGLSIREIDQRTVSNKWISLGTYTFDKGTSESVSLADLTSEPYISTKLAYDAVKWQWVGPAPVGPPSPGNGHVAVSIASIRMRSGHELEIGCRRFFGDRQYSVKVDVTIGGHQVSNTYIRKSSRGFSRPPNNWVDQFYRRWKNDVWADDAPFVLDLVRKFDRFTDNTDIRVNVSVIGMTGSGASDERSAKVLLPVILVPGIDVAPHSQGGDGTFPGLEEYLSSESGRSIANRNELGEGYYVKSSQITGYPTIYTLSYDRNHEHFNRASEKLNALIGRVLSQTYASKVNVVTHSKGGLIARQYLADNASAAPVRDLVMTVPPNLGSLYATVLGGHPLGNDYTDLLPLWQWYSPSPFGPWSIPDGMHNSELETLNNRRLPRSVRYTIVSCTNESTVCFWANANTRYPPLSLFDTLSDLTTFRRRGDGIVPYFSQIGSFNTTSSELSGPFIPAFEGLNLDMRVQDVDEQISNYYLNHVGYLERDDVMLIVFQKVFIGSN